MNERLQIIERVRRIFHRLEDGVLVALLMVLIGTAVTQIALRNLFGSGIAWGDVMVRLLVLWVGLVGAMAASRQDHHIRIDLVTRYFPEKTVPAIKCVTRLFTALVCGTLAYYSFGFVQMEFMGNDTAFGIVPVWLCAAIIPLSFLTIALRYAVSTLSYLIRVLRPAS